MEFQSETEISSGQAKGSLELKSDFNSNLLINNKWTSDNLFSTEVTILDRLHAGTRFSLIPTFDPKNGKLGGAIGVQYNNDFVSARCEAGLDDGKPMINPSFIAR